VCTSFKSTVTSCRCLCAFSCRFIIITTQNLCRLSSPYTVFWDTSYILHLAKICGGINWLIILNRLMVLRRHFLWWGVLVELWYVGGMHWWNIMKHKLGQQAKPKYSLIFSTSFYSAVLGCEWDTDSTNFKISQKLFRQCFVCHKPQQLISSIVLTSILRNFLWT
jgi:hypothetical protein